MEQAALTQNRAALRTLETESLVVGIIGAAALTIAIVGLAGFYPQMLLSIATIGIGAGLLLEGGAISTKIKDLLRTSRQDSMSFTQVGTGVSVEVMGGIAGIALGILSLLGVLPLTLIAVAALVYGGTLIFGSGMVSRLNQISIEASEENEFVKKVSREAVNASAEVQLMIGVGVITLGILSLVGLAPLELLLVAMLGLGASDLFSNSALGSRIMSILER